MHKFEEEFGRELALQFDVSRETGLIDESRQQAADHSAMRDASGYEAGLTEEAQAKNRRDQVAAHIYTTIANLTALLPRPDDVRDPHKARIMQSRTLIYEVLNRSDATYQNGFGVVIGEASTANDRLSLLVATHTRRPVNQLPSFSLLHREVDKASWEAVKIRQDAKIGEDYGKDDMDMIFDGHTGIYTLQDHRDSIRVVHVLPKDEDMTIMDAPGRIVSNFLAKRVVRRSSRPTVLAIMSDFHRKIGFSPTDIDILNRAVSDYEVPVFLGRLASRLGLQEPMLEKRAAEQFEIQE